MSGPGSKELNPLAIDPQRHIVCAIKSALGLIAGKPIQVSPRAYPCAAPSRTERALQVAYGIAGILATTGRKRTLVSGEQLAYRKGKIVYFADEPFRHWRAFGKLTRPFFLVPGGEPAKTIAAIIGCDPDPLPRLTISDIHCTVVVKANWHGRPAIIHYGECEHAMYDIEKRANGQKLALADGRFAAFLARTLSNGRLANGAAVMVQSRIESVPNEFSWSKLDTANELWLSRKLPAENHGFYQIESRLSDLRWFYPGYIDSLGPIMEVFSEWCESSRLPADLSHGDFWLGNVLFKGNDIAGIIDWEWPRKNGLPLVDALYMVLDFIACKNQRTLPAYLRKLWADEIQDREVTDRLAWICTQSGVDRDDLKFIGLALWFETLWKVGSSGWVNSDLWFNDLFRLTTPVIQRWLKSRSREKGYRTVVMAASAFSQIQI